jgi:uncharacterized protein GlcG (DUF336 family)
MRERNHRMPQIGGIGSSGGTIAQDIEVANAGLAAIQR